jgi:gamma-glutamyltranspeptidase/glutathione hydrolase
MCAAGLARLVAAVCLAASGGCSSPPTGPTGQAATAALRFMPPEPPSGYTPKRLVHRQRDMVVAAHPLAVQAGVEVLARGGAAVDAAIAVQLVLNLVEPQSSGIGGGGFLLLHDGPASRTLAYDGRETAPAAAGAGLFLRPGGEPLDYLDAADSGLSVGTPGLLRMLALAHRTHGRLPWATLFEPAIRWSDTGFPVSPRLAVSIAGAAPRIRAQGGPAASYFLMPDGSPRPAGSRLRNAAFADTLRQIAAGGAEVFYRGPMAQAIVDTVRAHPLRPGLLALADLAAYQPRVREPVCGLYRLHYRICSMPTPSSGGIAVLQTLAMLERFDLAALGPNSVDSVHLISEAYRLAYADRAQFVADSDFVPVPTESLLDPAYLRARAALIDPARSMRTPTPGQPVGAVLGLGADPSPGRPSTTQVSIVDRHGQAVSLTSSIEQGFGSLQMVGGFLLNNQLTDFSFAPSDTRGALVANRVEPGKRPRSAMAPTLVFDAHQGDLLAVIGSPGGSAIIQFVSKALVGLIDWRLDVQQAVDLPNFGAQTGALTLLEAGTALTALQPALEARGHVVQATPAFTSGLHGIVVNRRRVDGQPGLLAGNAAAGALAGGADPRREGVAHGND